MTDTTQPRPVLGHLLESVSLAAAAGLARAGHYHAAEELLAPGADAATQLPSWLDLRARISAQQGRLTEAEALWRQASEADPTNPVYRAALWRLEHLRRPRVTWALFGRRALGSALALLGVVALATVTLRLNDLKRALGPYERPFSTGQTAPLQAAVAPPAADVSAPAAWRITVPGVATRTLGPELVLAFEGGIFSEGALLTDEGKNRLTAVGQQLEAYVHELRVLVVGHTDDLAPHPSSRYADNPALALARAVAAIEHLRSSTSLPISILFAQAGTGGLPPDSPGPGALRRSDRTVELRISSRSGQTAAE